MLGRSVALYVGLAMITLAKKIKEEKEKKEKGILTANGLKGKRISVRDTLLTKGTVFSGNS